MDWTLLESFVDFLQVLRGRDWEGDKGVRAKEDRDVSVIKILPGVGQ